MARRLGTLENKTVYLVDTRFGGSYRFMQQLQKWFSANMPSVTTIRKRKTGGAFMDDTTDLWEEIKPKEMLLSLVWGVDRAALQRSLQAAGTLNRVTGSRLLRFRHSLTRAL